jgi:hypothetical protein
LFQVPQQGRVNNHGLLATPTRAPDSAGARYRPVFRRLQLGHTLADHLTGHPGRSGNGGYAAAWRLAICRMKPDDESREIFSGLFGGDPVA